MSYRFYAPRQTNFFPPGVPYFAGVGALGDYAADQARYQQELTAYNARQASYASAYVSYQRALADYTAACATIDANYAGSMRSYNQRYADYQAKSEGIKRANTEKALAIAKNYGITLSKAFLDSGACITAAQRDAYARNCVTVKGLMGLHGLGAADADCGWKLMPVCDFPAVPVKPVKKPYPAKPSPPPVPVAPVPPSVPLTNGGGGGSGSGGGGNPNSGGGPLVTTTPTTSDSDDDTKKSGMMRNGIIVAVVLGGGYLVYRTIKKPKAA